MKKSLLVLGLALLLGACATGKNISTWQEAYGPGFPGPKEGQAALYLIRGAAPPDAPQITVTMDGQPVVALSGSTWMRFDLTPKLYDLRSFGPTENSELIVTVDPGQTRFLRADPTPTGGAELLELSPLEGRRLVREGKEVQ